MVKTKKSISLGSRLRSIRACKEALEWVGDRELSAAWQDCERADWMLWLAGKMAGEPGWPSRQEIVIVACEIADSVLAIFEQRYPEDKRPRNAIEAARAWAIGNESIKQVKSDAASAAASAAAYAAADAASAAASAAAYAAAYAAYAAAYAAASAAAYAAAYAAADAAYAYAQKQIDMCSLIRKRINVPEVL